MPVKKTIYPVFLPHAGCPFRCVYCNQNAVASTSHPGGDPIALTRARLGSYAEQIRKSGRAGEIAFFGGTFTALPSRVIESLLGMAAQFVSEKLFTGIRFSTRPDCLDETICDLLQRYPVRTVELGVQSLSDRVLAASRRGYAANAAQEAAKRVGRHGWTLGVQLMAGLPGDSPELFFDSVRRGVRMGADFFRIYPTLVLEGTLLADWFSSGDYRPLSLDEAVQWVVPAYDLLMGKGIPVVRMGLHADPALARPGAVLAGPHHPSFGYLVRCRWWRDRADRELGNFPGPRGGSVLLNVAANRVSEVVGPKRSHIAYWVSRWGLKNLAVREDGALVGTEMRVELFQ